MDIDNITDIDILKLTLKKERAQMKQNVVDEDTGYEFKKGFWYKVTVKKDGIMIFGDESDATYWFGWDEEESFLRAYDE